ncbi:MAG: MlaD family protein [Muribaculaceae bacterium]
MKKFFSKEIMIALIVIAAMVLLFIGIEFLKGVNVFKAANYYYARYDNVTGLTQSASVTLNGFKVGQVREIQYEYNNPGHVLVELSLNRDLKLPEGTQALLATDLLGTASINLVLGDGTQYIEVGDTLDASVPKGLMDNVSQDVLPQLGTIFTKVDTLLTSINAVVGNEALLTSVQRLDAITANLERTTVQLNALMATLPPITSNVNTITGELAQASANVNTLTADLNNVPLDSIANNIQVLSENLRILSEQLNDPNSTLGMLTNDPTLYNNLSSAVANLDSLFVDIKRNPKRYISIKLL